MAGELRPRLWSLAVDLTLYFKAYHKPLEQDSWHFLFFLHQVFHHYQTVTRIVQYHKCLKVHSLGKCIRYDKGRGDEDIEGGLQKFLDTWKGGSEKNVGLVRGGGAPKICILQSQQRGVLNLEPWTTSERGLLKFQALSFTIFNPPPSPLVILNELSLRKLYHFLMF